MFVEIGNTPRPYAWGSQTAIAGLLGATPSGGPEAELWLGAHPGSPARIADPAQTGGALDLAAWIAADPGRALGVTHDGPRLPFLLKLLAAEHPLSLQAHPSAAQARAGYLREEEAGVAWDSPVRNYRDPYPKPEMIFALSERFEALCGFRPVEEARDLLQAFVDLDMRGDTPHPAPLYDLMDRLDSLPTTVRWLLEGGPQVAELVSRVSRIAVLAGYAGRDAFPEFVGARSLPGSFGFDRELATARLLAAEYPGDPGIVISLLLNRVTLARGEALYLPAGNIHAYLHGFGVELMTASDNVLRGGLTAKHVDAAELLRVLDFTPGAAPLLPAEAVAAGVTVYRPPVPAGTDAADAPDFALVHVVPGARAARDPAAGAAGDPVAAAAAAAAGASSDGGAAADGGSPDAVGGAASVGGVSGGAGAAAVGGVPGGAGAAAAGGVSGGVSASGGSSAAAGTSADSGSPDRVAVDASAVGVSTVRLTGPGIALCVAGTVTIAGATASVTLQRGRSVYITPDEARLAFAGPGELFLATTR